MPINIPDGLPAKKTLHEERIFALEEEVAEHQEIRPLRLAILNLMPKKIQTETQILRLISKSPIQVTCDFMRISSHESKNTAADHLVTFYSTFDDFKDKNYDGLIITGAPIEDLKYEDVDYWDEFCRIVDWSQEHVFSITCRTLVMLRLRHQLWQITLSLPCFLRVLPAVLHFLPLETFTRFL